MKHFLIIALVFLTAQAFSQKIGISGGMLTCYRVTANDTIKEHYPISACNIEIQKSKSDIQIFYNTGFTPRKIYGGKWNTTLNGDLQDFIDDFTSGSGGGGASPEIDLYNTFERVGSTTSLGITTRERLPDGTYDTYEYTQLDSVFNEPVVGGGSYFEITYADLTDAINNQTLIAGATYLLTDYKCEFQLPLSGSLYTGAAVEPLILKATSHDAIHPIAYSASYPQDIIYYQIGNEYSGGNSSKGDVIRRIDTKRNINVPFDFRAWQIEYDSPGFVPFDNGTTYNKNDIVLDGGYTFVCHTAPGMTLGWPDAAYFQQITVNYPIRQINDDNFSWVPGSNANGIGNIGSPTMAPPFDVNNTRNFVITDQPEYLSGCSFYAAGDISNNTFSALRNVFFAGTTQFNKGGKIEDTNFGNQTRLNNFINIGRCIIGGDFVQNSCGADFYTNALYSANGNNFNNTFQYNISDTGLDYNQFGNQTTNNFLNRNFKYNTSAHRLYNCTVKAADFGHCTFYHEVLNNDWTNYNAITFTPPPRTMSVHMDNAGLLQLLYLRDNGTFSVNPF